MLTLFPLQNQRMAHRTTIAELVIMEVRLFLFSTGRFDFLELKRDIMNLNLETLFEQWYNGTATVDVEKWESCLEHEVEHRVLW
jgi:hypothetical protein